MSYFRFLSHCKNRCRKNCESFMPSAAAAASMRAFSSAVARRWMRSSAGPLGTAHGPLDSSLRFVFQGKEAIALVKDAVESLFLEFSFGEFVGKADVLKGAGDRLLCFAFQFVGDDELPSALCGGCFKYLHNLYCTHNVRKTQGEFFGGSL